MQNRNVSALQEKEIGFLEEKKLCTECDKLSEQDIAEENAALSGASLNEINGGKTEAGNPAGSLCGWSANPYGLPPIHLGDTLGSPAAPESPLSDPNNTNQKQG